MNGYYMEVLLFHKQELKIWRIIQKALLHPTRGCYKKCNKKKKQQKNHY